MTDTQARILALMADKRERTLDDIRHRLPKADHASLMRTMQGLAKAGQVTSELLSGTGAKAVRAYRIKETAKCP